MSYPFEFFRHNWLKYEGIFDPFADFAVSSFSLDTDFFTSLKFDKESLQNYRIDAIQTSIKVLGSKPALCLSGGIDSQAMVLAFLEAGVDFEVFLMRFNKNFNSMDSDHAITFAEKYGITLNIFDIDIVRYLTFDLQHDAEIYKCSSPHFLTHYKLYDYIRESGCTGIVSAGNSFSRFIDGWGASPSAMQYNYIKYAEVHNFPIIGSFFLYDPAVCWSLGLLTPSTDHNSIVKFDESNTYLNVHHARYATKVAGYYNIGLEVIPQDTKYSGFEKLKEFFAEKFANGWAFENQFRHPLEKKFGKAVSKLVLSESQTDIINKLHDKNFASMQAPASSIC
jgi:hypothetical protein